MKRIVYDCGVLIAADRDERRAWADHRARLEANIVPLVPAAVVAQASRSSKQVSLRRMLRGCEVAAFDEPAAHRAGALLAKSRTKDVVDAAVVELAVRSQADIATDDRNDIAILLAAARAKTSIVGV
jgi:hypothetical protein